MTSERIPLTWTTPPPAFSRKWWICLKRMTKNFSYLSDLAEPQNHSRMAQWRLSSEAAWSPITNAGTSVWTLLLDSAELRLSSRHLLDAFLQVSRWPSVHNMLYLCSDRQLVSYLGLANKIRYIYCLFLQPKASGPYMFGFWPKVLTWTTVMNSKASILQKLKSCSCWISRWVIADIQSRRTSVCSIKGLTSPHSLIQGSKEQ